MAEMRRRRILFYLPDLAGGGVERVQLLLAQNLLENGYDVAFVLHEAKGKLVGCIPDGAGLITLDVRRTSQALIPLIRLLRREKPDIFLSALGHNNIIGLCAAKLALSGASVVISQHNALSAESVKGQGLRFSRLLPVLYRLFVRYADGIVAVSRGIASEMADLCAVGAERITVIYNPVVTRSFERAKNEPCAHRWVHRKNLPIVLGVGRFVELKDFATLIDAFAKVLRKKECRLILLGNGPLQKALETQAEKRGIRGCCDFPGFQQNPLPFMRAASVVVLPSSHEGFGNVLVEALTCGTPVVSTRCPFSPPEVLENGRWGKLVEVGDSKAMAEAIMETLENPPDAEALCARGHEFTESRAVSQYLALFDKILKEKEGRTANAPASSCTAESPNALS